MLLILKYGVIAAFLISVFSLTYLVLKTFSFGRRAFHAKSNGSPVRGMIYAFGQGMTPWEKESAGKHMPTYFTGILYHTGIFVGLAYLLLIIISVSVPGVLLILFQIFFTASFLAGVGLLLKRLFSTKMKAISNPDDFFANILVNIFLLLSLLHSFNAGFLAPLLLGSMVMFLYMPLGKIRHCFFFFYVRILFGVFFGRRNVFPPAKKL